MGLTERYIGQMTIRKVMVGGGGGFSSCKNFFSLTFPLQGFFSVCKNSFTGLLAVYDYFSLNFPFHEFFFVLRPPP